MKKIVMIIVVLMNSLYGDLTSYSTSNKQSNSYFKAVSDVVFFGSDEIIGVNKKLTGFLIYENNKIQNGEIIIFSSGFDTQNTMRDKHIQEILNTKINPKINFTIKEQFENNNQQFVQGVLKINGVEKTQTIPVQIQFSNNTILMQGKFNIKYEDFGIKIPTLGGFLKRANETIEIGGKFTFTKDSK